LRIPILYVRFTIFGSYTDSIRESSRHLPGRILIVHQTGVLHTTGLHCLFARIRGERSTSLMFEYKRQKDEVGNGGELPDTGNYYPGMPGLSASPMAGPSNYYDEVLFNQADPFYDSTDLNSPMTNADFVDPFAHGPAVAGSLVIGGSDDAENEPTLPAPKQRPGERNVMA